MAQLDYILQGINCYVDGVGKLGAVEKMQTPKFKKVMEKFRPGGTLGTRQHAMGYEPFELEFEFNAYDPQILRKSGLFSAKSFPLSMTAAFDGERNQQHGAQFVCRGQFMEVDAGTWEPGKKAMLKVKGTLAALKLIMDGETIYDIDEEADKCIIDGVDEYAWIRNIL